MWVTVREMNGLTLRGILDNEPYDIPQLRLGDLVEFRRDQIYDIIWNADKEVAPPPSPERRDYWERCYADEQIVKNGLKVEFLYRVVPDAETADDDYPDSGWRFRCDTRSLTDEEYENSEFSYIAIGKVLNADDSWLHLIDEPVGSCFLRNWDTGAFEIGDRDVEGDQ